MADTLLDLRYLVAYYAGILGDKYHVLLNSLEYPERGTRTVVTLHARRVPMPVDKVNAETLEITLNFRLDTKVKVQVMADMAKLLGAQYYDITTLKEDGTADKQFRVNSFLDQNIPIGNPGNDTSEIMANYQVTGTVLVSAKGDGAVMSNDVVIEINGEQICALSCNAQYSKTVDTAVRLNESRITPLLVAQGMKYTLTVLNTGSTVDSAIMADIENMTVGALSRTYAVKRTYPNGTVIQKNCTILGGSIIENAGAYVQYAVEFQEV